MAIRLTLECGHVSILRERISPEGFTHDWEVFVRGVDNTDIHHYIEKVVFQLHETFPKPKRVVKEPPYMVKESGYAGFTIPIHVYLKNKDEPKRFQILYKLNLQPRGKVINKAIRHIEIINNPSEEFKRKLLKGGGCVIPSAESTSERSEVKTPVMVGKPKLSIGEPKKHRPIESKTSNSFAELFGPPIKTAKIFPDNKKVTQYDKSSTVKPISVSEKADKVDKITKSKDSPHKDTKKDKTEEKKDKKIKDPSKEKSRSKEKSKRSSSPGSKIYSSPTNKRLSPPPLKRPRSSSPPSSVKRSSPPKSKEKDIKKSIQEKEREKDKDKEKEKERDKDKDKAKDNSKSSLDINKTDKKKDKKKYKDDNYKEKKDKYKEGERSSVKEVQKISDKKLEKADKEKDKSQDYKSIKDGRKSPKSVKESDKIKDDKLTKVDKLEKGEKSEKVKENKSDKDRTKHKHKKKDKKEKRDSSREREKKEKRDKSKSSAEKQNNMPASSNPLSMLFANMPERDSSDSAPSVDDESFAETKPIILNVKKELEDTAPLTVPTDQATRPPSPPPIIEIKKEKSDHRSKRDRPKSSRGEERESKKRKRRSESKGDEEHNIKREKDRSHSTSPLLELVSSSQSPVVVDGNSIRDIVKEKDRNMIEQTKKEGETDGEQVVPDSTNCTLVESDSGEPPVFSEDYVSQLKDLQHKIMTLQDNDELQRVVRVIEETGQYEITKKTFDFDLCALDRRTVQRLQQFFSAS
ncbi:hypothetical protein M0802_002421 [Mischocyttarus mexicanus]|nr:hypothetical protein M0802_002421 [Mischocyttarus mexicanus]